MGSANQLKGEKRRKETEL